MPVTTNGEHRKLIGVKARLCLSKEYGLYCWDAASVSKSELQPTEKIVSCAAQPAKSSSVVQNYLLCRLQYPIIFLLQCYVAIALALWRGAAARLSIHD